MYSVGIVPLRKHFQNCIVLVGQGRFLCQRCCVSRMGGFIGISGSIVHHKIGSQNRLIFFGLCFIPRMYGVLVMTNFAESQQ